MSPDESDTRRDDLLSTLEVIEAQPLRERADAYASVHDDLARHLDSGPRDARA